MPKYLLDTLLEKKVKEGVKISIILWYVRYFYQIAARPLRMHPKTASTDVPSSYNSFYHADLSQLHQTTTDRVAPEYYGSALAITFSGWYILLGTCKLEHICPRPVDL